MDEIPDKASVIIPCRNEVNHIENCIRAVLASTYKNTEILIVEGLSDDGTREKLKAISALHPEVRIVDNPAQTTPTAFNIGIKNSTGNFIFIVGSRHLIQSNYIATCIDILNSDPGIGCVGGKVQTIFEDEKSRVISQALNSSFAIGASNFRVKENDSFVDTVGTPAYRRSIFREVGLFDENLLRNQDDEFNYRVIQKGYKILLTTKTSIEYYVRASFKKLEKQYYQYGYWKVYVNKKHKAVTTFRQLVPPVFVLFVLLGAAVSFFSRSILLAYLFCLAVYTGAGLFASAKAGAKLSEIPKVIYTFFLLHFSYGRGYLAGIWDFAIINKKPTASASSLTR